MNRFEPYKGDMMGLPVNSAHLVFLWLDDTCKIIFSVSRQGMGASCHFASDKKGLRKLRQAIDEFCQFVFDTFEWCEMIIAKTTRHSVARLVDRCGFRHVSDINGVSVYVRCKKWDS